MTVKSRVVLPVLSLPPPLSTLNDLGGVFMHKPSNAIHGHTPRLYYTKKLNLARGQRRQRCINPSMSFSVMQKVIEG